jgi:nicotinate-nucleotide adenylyltransferase
MTQRVGILGGTFNPIHLGHLRAAEEALEILGLDSFLFIPSAVPPHKQDKAILPFEDRWEMLRIAIEGHPFFRLSDLEHRLSGKSYTVASLRKLNEELPGDAEIYFLVGMDAFLEINTWWHYTELFKLARMAALRRPGYPEEELEVFLKNKVSPLYEWDDDARCFHHPDLQPVYYLKTTHMAISSTQIRLLVREGKSIRYLVPDGVMRYIKETGFYRQTKTSNFEKQAFEQ